MRLPNKYIYIMKALIVTLTVLVTVINGHSWEQPGCFKLGHTRKVHIPGCVSFQVTTNACRGFCMSYAVPSNSLTQEINPNHILTSRSSCCSIDQTHDVVVNVRCIDGMREYTFKSAASCKCSICRRG
ncbi:unnamed protein product [Owenia fusiformis]|uniref:Uncharacterized protein n=1 Tax=Owenia fusiformis TaxID=6347 RepID=A0A8J1U224_OWEFU|nr:unnamed protein product [Owenia fusiformis]